MTVDDALYQFRLGALGLAQELGNVRAACRAMGIHPSYRRYLIPKYSGLRLDLER